MDERKLKISIVGLNYAPEPTGIAPYTSRLAEGLVRAGHDVEVLTGYPHYPEWRLREGYTGWWRRESINGVSVQRFRHFIPSKVNLLQRLAMEMSFGLRVVTARWNNPDVVLVVTPALLAGAIVALRIRYGMKRPPMALWVQDIYTSGLKETNSAGSFSINCMEVIERFVYSSAAELSVIHERFRTYVKNSLRITDVPIRVIRNWTHFSQPRTVQRTATRERLGWGEDEIIVLHAGNMGAKQGLENVIVAARLADEQASNIRFVLLGDGNQRDRLEASAKGIGRVDFLRPLPEEQFGEALRSADILLVNEKAGLRDMAIPSKLTTYFSANLPVIAVTEPDSGTADEIGRSGAGIRVDPDSPTNLLAASQRLADDRAFAAKLANAGTRYAQSVLSEEAAIIQYNEWLNELAHPSDHAGPDAFRSL